VTRTCGSEMWTWGVALGRGGMGSGSIRFRLDVLLLALEPISGESAGG